MTSTMNWHRWFAWYPVRTIGNHHTWLKTIERRWNWNLNHWAYDIYSGADGGWEYRLRPVSTAAA